MNELALQIKNNVNINSVFASIGLYKNRKGFVCCPFHSEKTASLKIFEDTNTFNCFGCGIGGDAITFYEKYYQENFIEAVKHIDNDFNLGLNVGKKSKPTFEQKKNLQNLKKQELLRKSKIAEVERLNNERDIWIDKWVKADMTIRDKIPQLQDEELNIDFVEALKNIEYYSYMIDCYENELWRFGNE